MARANDHELVVRDEGIYAVPHEGGDAQFLSKRFVDALDAYRKLDGTCRPPDVRFVILLGLDAVTEQARGSVKRDTLIKELDALEVFDASYESNIDEIELVSEGMRGCLTLTFWSKRELSVMLQYVPGGEELVARVRDVLTRHGLTMKRPSRATAR